MEKRGERRKMKEGRQRSEYKRRKMRAKGSGDEENGKGERGGRKEGRR